MKNKIIISAVAVVIVIAALFAVITFTSKLKQNNGGEAYDNMEDAANNAAFSMDYPDRLGGIPATGFESNSSMIEVSYGDGYIRKTLGVADNSSDKTDYSEVAEQSVNGMTVTFKGSDGLVYLAVWNYNNFAYTISVPLGVEPDEMVEYIESTR